MVFVRPAIVLFTPFVFDGGKSNGSFRSGPTRPDQHTTHTLPYDTPTPHTPHIPLSGACTDITFCTHSRSARTPSHASLPRLDAAAMTDITQQIHTSMHTFTAHTFMPFLNKQHQDLLHSQQEFSEQVDTFHTDLVQQQTSLEGLQTLQQQQRSDFKLEEQSTLELEQQVSYLQKSASELLPNQIINLSKSLEASRLSNENLSKDLSSMSRIATREIDAVTRGVEMFKNILGVQFEVKDGKLQILYRYIIREEPLKPFMIAIYVDENKEYQIHACTPELPMIQTLIEELNKSNNFAKFIGQVRKQFVASVQQEEEEEAEAENQ